MRKVRLFYNPLSGRRRGRRQAEVETAQAVLHSAGIEASIAATKPGDAAGDQVKQAIAEGCDTVFACGGDGTVHDLLQALVGTEAVLGIIPLGTANSLAHDLRLPLSPMNAAKAALQADARRIAVGKISYLDFNKTRRSRYFTVTVGIGVDAHLFYKLNPSAKRRLGMSAYYVKATHLWLTHPMEHFAVEFVENAESKRAEVSQLLAVRIEDFGGVLRELAPGASLQRSDLRLVLFRTRSRAAYLCYVMRGLLGTRWRVPGIELVHSSGVACQTLSTAADFSRILVEADGELLGTLPAEISVVPDAVTILTPRR